MSIPEGSGREVGLGSFIRKSRLNWLLLFVPVSLALELFAMPRLWIFTVSALAILPLAGLIGEATEQLAHRLGPGTGGLLNATFGNAAELIIALFALQAGHQELVKASISGSIIANILLVFGLSMLMGGWGRDRQTFNPTRAGANSAMLVLAAVALVMPAVFDLAIYGTLEDNAPIIEQLSLLVALVLIATYLASLVFSLKTHQALATPVSPGHREVGLSPINSILLLFISMIIVAAESELLVGSIYDAMAASGMSEFFIGIVVVAIIGNSAEHFSAVHAAMKNDMELSVTIATGSATQIALFVAPVLVFVSLLLGKPMSLVFNIFEIVGIGFAVLILSVVSLDGESNWFEGVQLLAVYLVLVIVFYFVPAA